MLLDPDDTRPPHTQVADALRREIEDGTLPAGAKLPTHKQLSSKYEISIGTVKRALGELQGAGLIISRQGQGAFVRTRRNLLDDVPRSLAANTLQGAWATSYRFHWQGDTYYHADITQIAAQSNRQLTAKNYPPEPRTSTDDMPAFLNDIAAQLLNRHVIGQWKNVNDARYFGSLQLAILPGEAILNGYYTSYLNDIEVDAMPWKWVRIDPLTLSGVDWETVSLHDPATLHDVLDATTEALPLSAITDREHG